MELPEVEAGEIDAPLPHQDAYGVVLPVLRSVPALPAVVVDEDAPTAPGRPLMALTGRSADGQTEDTGDSRFEPCPGATAIGDSIAKQSCFIRG